MGTTIMPSTAIRTSWTSRELMFVGISEVYGPPFQRCLENHVIIVQHRVEVHCSFKQIQNPCSCFANALEYTNIWDQIPAESSLPLNLAGACDVLLEMHVADLHRCRNLRAKARTRRSTGDRDGDVAT